MSIAQEAARGDDPYIIGVGRRSYAGLPRFEHAQRTLASKRVISAYGFWIFLLSDIIMFSAFFAAYAVLSGQTAGGPSGKDLFDITRVALQTTCLLLSSFACGVASIGARARNDAMYYGGMTATALLGAAQAEDKGGTIKVGILHSLSGTMAISETSLKDTMLMLIAEQNAKGGLLGKKLEAVVVDPASDWPLFAEKARELLQVQKVAAVFGCWTSV